MWEIRKKAESFMKVGERGRIEDIPKARRPFLITREDSITVVGYDIRGKQYEQAVFTAIEQAESIPA